LPLNRRMNGWARSARLGCRPSGRGVEASRQREVTDPQKRKPRLRVPVFSLSFVSLVGAGRFELPTCIAGLKESDRQAFLGKEFSHQVALTRKIRR
jgi:hypothetical protein